jgi:hypothetical protein
MKTLLNTIICCLYLPPMALFGQVEMKNISLNNPDVNYLYRGWDNQILITGVDSNRVIAMTSYYDIMEITQVNKTLFNVKPKYGYWTQPVLDSLYLLVDGIKVLAKDYEIKGIYPQLFKIGSDKYNDTVTVEKILADPEVHFFPPDFQFKLNFKVVDLDMILIKKDNDIIHEFDKMDNNKLTLLEQELIGQMNSGDRIVFMNIKIEGPDGLVRPINGWRLIIK